MSVQPLEDVLSELEHEEACEWGRDYGGCSQSAEWLAWRAHALAKDGSHCPNFGYVCETHRQQLVATVARWIQPGGKCSCGFSKAGPLSEYVKAIKL